jgi:hypothetical protein
MNMGESGNGQYGEMNYLANNFLMAPSHQTRVSFFYYLRPRSMQ